MNDALLAIMGLVGLGALWFVLFGQKRYNDYMKQ
jgi:hypothetical protein